MLQLLPYLLIAPRSAGTLQGLSRSDGSTNRVKGGGILAGHDYVTKSLGCVESDRWGAVSSCKAEKRLV
jgi:hypothetical protein